MKLTFSILWFDDNPTFVDSLDLETLKNAIKSWGFVPVIKFVHTPEEFKLYSPFKEFDLIAVDYKLGEHPHGEEFIRDIRGHGVFTEVIFYSNVPSTELWEAIRNAQLEGVFIANRQVIADKIEKVGRQSVNKILDLNNMRGIVMAEVGELDVTLEAILREGVSGLDENGQGRVFKGVHKRASQQAAEDGEKLKTFQGNPTVDALISLATDSAKRWMCFVSVLKRHADLLDEREKIGDYQKEVLWPRNCLAHGIPEESEAGVVFTYQGKAYKFDDTVALELRQTIMGYRERFDAIKIKLSARSTGT
jgi:hypothetical protein